jgi:hypothetical protein
LPFIPDALAVEVTQFLGPNLVSDPYDIPPEGALQAWNVEYSSNGEVRTRFGHSAVWNPGDGMSSMANWLYTNGGIDQNTLVYYTQAVGVRQCFLSSPGQTTIMPALSSADGASFAPDGIRLYAAFYNSSGKPAGLPAGGGEVYSAVELTAKSLFERPPIVTSEVTGVATEPAGGAVTAGVHRIGFFLDTAHGYESRLAPLSSTLTWAPITFTASGNHDIQVVFTPVGGYTWPVDAQFTAVMTPVTNLNKPFIVPFATTKITSGNVNLPVTGIINISDADLISDASRDVTLLQTTFSQDAAHNAPFTIQFLFTYGERMAYVGLDSAHIPVVYFSEPNSFQKLDAGKHGVYLPGNRPLTLGFSLRGVAYLLGPHWTYSTSDNGGFPSTWADPQLVDGEIGCFGPHCVFVSLSQGFAWVADQGGLYLFSGGQYPARPISYYQGPDWRRINWNAATRVYVVDDKDRKRVTVYAPLDGASTPSHRLRFSYINGTEAEQICYSLDQIAGYPMGAACLAETFLTRQLTEFIGPAVGDGVHLKGSVIAQNIGGETNPFRDLDQAINCVYKTSLLPGQQAQRGTTQIHHADQIRIRGAGHAGITIRSLDDLKSRIPAKSPLVLSVSPGQEYMLRYNMTSEHVTLELNNNNELDSWYVLSQLNHMYNEQFQQR